jgi:peptidoglycan/LPS O-acetylase OafA/YrhL
VGHGVDPAAFRLAAAAQACQALDVRLPRPADDTEQAHARQWRLAQVNLGIAGAFLLVAVPWWFVDDATWQRPVFTVLGLGLVIAALANLRQQKRNRRRRASIREQARERENPR